MNKIIQALRQGMVQKLLIHSAASPVIPAQSGVYVPVLMEEDKLLLKSIEITANKQIEFRVQFFEEAALSNSRYNSGSVSSECYDVLDLPFMDKDGTKTMHFYIENLSEYDAEFSLEVRGIIMK